MNAFAIIVVALMVGCAVFIFYKIWYTKKNGIEANAVVSRIEESTGFDSDGSTTSYDYYVLYTDTEGKQQEAKLSNPGWKGYSVGDRITIKYLPEKPYQAVWIKK